MARLAAAVLSLMVIASASLNEERAGSSVGAAESDPPRIVLGAVGSVRMGMSRSTVERVYGPPPYRIFGAGEVFQLGFIDGHVPASTWRW